MSKQGHHIDCNKLFFDLCQTQSELLFPVKKGAKGPKKSFGRYLIIAGVMLAKKTRYPDGPNKGKRMFSNKYLKLFIPKNVNLNMYGSYLK